VTQKYTDEPIDLLVTDLVMPKMGGVELAGRLQAMRPDLRVLFISSDFIEPQKVLAFGAKFLAKPFALSTLSIVVHEILHTI
jgi:YesN/AraC family two-component response regulator